MDQRDPFAGMEPEESPLEDPFAGMEPEEGVEMVAAPLAKSEETIEKLRYIPKSPELLSGGGQALKAVAGSIAGQAVAGLAGIGTGLFEGAKAISPWHEADWNAPAGVVEQVQEKAGRLFAPTTEEGVEATANLAGGIEGAVDIVGRIIKTPVAGVMRATGNEAEAERFMDEPMGEYLGDKTMEKTGSPLAATAARLTPDAVLASLGIRRGPDAPKIKDIDVQPHPVDVPTRGSFSPTIAETGPGGKPIVDVRQPMSEAELKGPAANLGRRKTDERTMLEIDPNPEIVEAFRQLDIEPGVGMVSENQAVRQIASGLKAETGSPLKGRDIEVREQLQRKADELVEDFGNPDRSALDQDIRADFNETITGLETAATEAFRAMNTTERLSTRTALDDLVPLQTYLRDRIAAMGGVDELGRMDRRLFDIIYRRHTNEAGEVEYEMLTPTYGKLDFERGVLGNEMKSQSMFKDSSSGDIEHAYGLLRQSQGRAASRMGFGDEYTAANQLVVSRKLLEAESVVALGREMARGIIASIDAGAGRLSKGDVNRFRQMMAAVPEQHQQAVAMAVLQKLMMRGEGGNIKPSIVNMAKDLDRYQQAKNLLFSYMPAEARAKFDNLVIAARGFYRSLETDNHSNTAPALAVLDSLNSGSLSARLAGTGGEVMAGEWIGRVLGAPEGVGAAISVGIKGAQYGLQRTGVLGASRSQKADAFLASDGLNQAVREYAASRPQQAQAALSQSPEYRAWIATIGKEEVQAIESIGFFGWLLNQGQN